MSTGEKNIKKATRKKRSMIKPEVRAMSAEHRQVVAPKVGRKPAPSIFLEEVRAAIGTGEAFEIDIPEGVKPATIVSELKKAGKQLGGVHVKIWNRSKQEEGSGVAPFIGFTVVDPDPAPPVALAIVPEAS